MIWVGLVLLIVTIWALLKRYEPRLVLVISGLVMACVAGDPMAAFTGMSNGMTAKSMILNICSVMGFAYTMRFTLCDKHMGHALARPLHHVQLFLVPGAAIITFLVNFALPTCAGTCAAVGSVLIPLLVSLGVRPVMAASAVMAGCFGEMLSPGMLHNVYVAEIATKYATAHGQGSVSVMDVIAHNATASVISLVVAVVCIWGVAVFLKEYKGYASQSETVEGEDFKVNYLFAILPVIPITLLLLGSVFKQELPALSKLAVPHCMLIGSALALILTKSDAKKFSVEFFNGMGKGYGDTMGIIISAYIMLAGLQALGLIKAGEELMKSSESLASICAMVGPFVLAMITGSGNSATMIFNGAITINAPEFGMGIIDMGTLATLAGCLGRACSPLAAGAIICAGFAGLESTLDMTKRTLLPAVVTTIVAYFILT